MGKPRALLAALLAISLGGVAWASPLLTLRIEGSTSADGPFSSSLSNVQPGQVIYYEVNALFNNGATNSNTRHVPDGATDGINSLPLFQLTAGSDWTLSNGMLQNGFDSREAGVGVTQRNGPNTAVIRAVNSPGVYLNADSPLTIETGQLTVGTTRAGGNLIGAAYYSYSGLVKVSGVYTAIIPTTESSADPITAYSPLSANTVDNTLPEPASLAIFSLAAVGLLQRRRKAAC